MYLTLNINHKFIISNYTLTQITINHNSLIHRLTAQE
jgi:hypothetical protein